MINWIDLKTVVEFMSKHFVHIRTFSHECCVVVLPQDDKVIQLLPWSLLALDSLTL